MNFVCHNGPCQTKFSSRGGLAQHRRYCEYADPSIVVNASEKYAARKARKRRRIEEPAPLPELISETPNDFDMDSPSSFQDAEQPAPDTPFLDMQPELEPELLGRSHRKKRPTWKVLQSLPDPTPPPIEETAPHPAAVPESAPQADHPAFVWKAIRTQKNSFGMWREYPDTPSHVPGSGASPPSQPDGVATALPQPPPLQVSPSHPFTSSTAVGLMKYMWTGSSTKSISEFKKLVSFLKSDEFKKEDLEGFDLVRETKQLDGWLNDSASSIKASHEPQDLHSSSAVPIGSLPFPSSSGCTRESGSASDSTADSPIPSCVPCGHHSKAGWRTANVDIEVPDGRPHTSQDEIPRFTVPKLQLRSLVEVIKSAFSNPQSQSFHYTPFKLFWSPPSTGAEEPPPAERIYNELFSSDAMIEEHARIHDLPAEKFEGQDLERVVAAMMVWSDSTHLTEFGNASVWPIYLYFGNQSKYDRAKPTSAACHHVAYMPKLPDAFNDWFRARTNKVPDADILAHCCCEVLHQVWQLLLDDEFMHAYEHGIVILCPDGKYRRFYPRIFTYSADYPEKVMLATIRNMGGCPCPRCLLPKTQIFEMGTKYDQGRRIRLERIDEQEFSSAKTGRKWLYEEGEGIKSAAMKRLLQPKSLVPTLNAFAKLASFIFSIRKALVVDLMHEFELGVWKALFTHLVRILYTLGVKKVQDLNRRYRLVPTFASTIRRFSDDAASMRKMAARNFEDLLQCTIPCFEGLIPEPHNGEILTLLYTMAEWHTLAKLRLHTSSTLQLLQDSTSDLGRMLRRFRSHTCAQFPTKELPSETEKRARQAARKKAKGTGSAATATTANTKASSDNKLFSLSTYKLHALGDYAPTIERLGTTDSYSTQTGELEHRRVKKYYKQTNKKNHTAQMSRLERREHFLSGLPESSSEPGKSATVEHQVDSTVPHYIMSTSRNHPLDLTKFATDNWGHPSVTDFIPKLKKHLLWRMLNPSFAPSSSDDDFSRTEYDKIHIVQNRMYDHKTLRINYTTYDLQRAQDFLGVNQETNILCLPRDEDSEQPFEYACILRIFHVIVTHQVPGGDTLPQTYDVLFVRRYKVDKSHQAGFKRKRLHRLKLLPESDPDAFGFVDPDNVIRAAHLIPAFGFPPVPAADSLCEPHEWQYWYMNIFADRDFYMRYRGGGIGHYHVPLPPDEDDLTALPPETAEELSGVIAKETPDDNDNNEEEEDDTSSDGDSTDQGEDNEDEDG